MKKILTTAVLSISLLSASFGYNQHNNRQITGTNQDKIGQLAYQYFESHPEKLMNLLQNMQSYYQQKQDDDAKQTLINDAPWLIHENNLPTTGNPNAKNTLLFIFDYQCVYCYKQYPILQNLVKTNNNLQVVFVPTHIFGDSSLYANKIGYQAQKQGKFLQFFNALHEKNLIEGKLNNQAVDEVARSVGVNIDEANSAKTTQDFQNLQQKIDQLIQQLAMRGTPYMAIMPTNTGIVKSTDIKNIDLLKGYVEANTINHYLK